MDKEFFNGKTVLVMGLGQFGGGLDSAVFAHDAGAKVIITDLAAEQTLEKSLASLREYDNIEYHLGGHAEEDFSRGGGADIIIVNPAVPPNNRFLQIALNAEKFITSQIEIFFELCPSTIIGITGANGKSTTTALAADLLNAGSGQKNVKYGNVFLGGNIGNKPLLARLDEMKADDLVVLELSSFQLEQLARIQKAPYASILTNLTPNHLDRHGTFEEYCRAKEGIFSFQTLDETNPAVSIFNAEDPIAMQWFHTYSNQPGRKCITFKPEDVGKRLAQSFGLPGRVNLSNLAAALAAAKHFGVSKAQMADGTANFRPLPHRLEFVAAVDGVLWYNDSIATTPASAIAALEAFNAHKIIIAGGYDKNLPFTELGERIVSTNSSAVLIGQTADKIEHSVKKIVGNETQVEIAFSMADAVNIAYKLARRGDIVILSPACASYDMFENYQQRGEIFRSLVLSMKR